jgi:hypothetical protein
MKNDHLFYKGQNQICSTTSVDSISSHFNVLNMPISTTAPIDAKTHVWPIDSIAQWLTNQRSLLGQIQAKTWDGFWLAQVTKHRVNNYKRIIDMHIILVHVVHSIQQILALNTPIKTNILLKCSLTLTILIIIWIYIILLFQFIWDFIYSAIIHMCLMSVMEFSRAEYSADHSGLFRWKTAGICAIVAVVDTRSLAGTRNHWRNPPPPFSFIRPFLLTGPDVVNSLCGLFTFSVVCLHFHSCHRIKHPISNSLTNFKLVAIPLKFFT